MIEVYAPSGVPTPAPTANLAVGGSTLAFRYSGAPQYITIPGSVNEIHVKLWGSGTSIGNFFYQTVYSGGAGGYAGCSLRVTPGETLRLIVGGPGSDYIPFFGGFGGGGSGFSSNIFLYTSGGILRTLTNILEYQIIFHHHHH